MKVGRLNQGNVFTFHYSNSTGFEVEFDSSLILQPGGLANLLFINLPLVSALAYLEGSMSPFISVTLSLMWQTVILLDTQNVICLERYLKRNLKCMNNQVWICQLLVYPLTEIL